MVKPLSNRFPVVLLNLLRCCGAVLFFTVILLIEDKMALLLAVPVKSAAIFIGGTILAIGLGESLYVWSLRYLEVARAYPLSSCTYPIVTIIIAFFLFQEELVLLTLIGIIVVLLGIYFLATPPDRFFTRITINSRGEKRGLLLLSLAVIAWGISTIAIRMATRDIDPLPANFLRMTGVVVILLPVALRQGVRASKPLKWRGIGLALLNGSISFGLGGYLFLTALQKSGASLTSVLTSTSPVFLLPMSVFFLKEKVTFKMVVGATLCVIGICLTILPNLLGD